MTLQELIVKIGADITSYKEGIDVVLRKSQEAGGALDSVGARSTGLEQSLRAVGLTTETLGSKMSSLGTTLSVGITAPLVGLGAASLKVAGQLEQNTIAFTTMMKSSEGAQQHLEALREFALKTPFEFSDLVLASKRLQALGFSAKEVIPTLTAVGNAAAALGTGAEGIQRITTALGQMQAKGRVQAEEMKQLAEAGIPAWQILAKTLNTDVAGAMDMVKDRAVESSRAIPALLAGMNEQFGGLMEKQSKTLLGQFSNLKDAINFTLQDVGKSLGPTASKLMQDVVQPLLVKLKELAGAFASLDPGTQQFIIALGALAAAAGPVLLVGGKLITSFGQISTVLAGLPALLNPVTLAIVALGTAAGVAWMELSKGTAPLRSLQDEFGKYVNGMIQMEAAAGRGAYAHQKLDEALAAGAMTRADYAKALELLAAAENKFAGSAGMAALKEMGLSFNVVVDGAKKAGAAVGGATEANKSHILTVQELMQRQASLNAEYEKAHAELLKMEARYAAGKASIAELALAKQQEQKAWEATTAAMTNWEAVMQRIIRESKTGNEAAYATARAYLQIAKDFSANSAEASAAHKKMVAALQDTGVQGIDIWKRLVAEAGGYVVEVVNGSQKTLQASNVSGKSLAALNEIWAALQGKARGTADAMASGVQKTTQYVGDGTQKVDVYVGHVAAGAQAWNANAVAVNGVNNAIGQAISTLEQYVDVLGTIRSSIEDITVSQIGYRQAVSDTMSVMDDLYFQAGRVTAVLGTFDLSEWSLRWRGNQVVVDYIGPDPAGYPGGVHGARPKQGTAKEEGYGRGYETRDTRDQEQERERLNAALLEMIAAGNPFDAISKFAAQIGAFVGKGNLGELIVQFKQSLESLRVPYQEIAEAVAAAIPRNQEGGRGVIGVVEDVGNSISGAVQVVGEVIQGAMRDLGDVVSGAINTAAGTALGVAQVMAFKDLGPVGMPAVTVPALAGPGNYWRDWTPNELRALGPMITITGNTFRSPEDADYLAKVMKERF